MDASIQQNLEKLLGQHLEMMEVAIGRAHDDSQKRLVSGLLDINVSFRRLEAKLERIAESVSMLQTSTVAGDGMQGVLERKFLGSEGCKQSQCSNDNADSGVREEVATVRSKSLLEIIEKVCKEPAGDMGTGPLLKQQPSASYKVSTCVGSDTIPGAGGEQSKLQPPAQFSDQHVDVDVPEKQATFERSQPKGAVELSFKRRLRKGISFSHERSRIDLLSPKGSRMDLLSPKPVLDAERKLEALNESIAKKLERIAYALGIRNLNVVDNSADDAEDRKRLMEKLKTAFDNDKRNILCKPETDLAKWLEHFFGICKADQRIGKRGSRYK
jgi:hypothetical protein